MGGGDGVRLRPGAEHFRVAEVPAYELCGEGEHLYVEVEKENLTTEALASALARACGRPPRDVGFAGRKDRHAVASQWFSVHFGREEALADLELPRAARLEVLRTSRHRNKLRLGHLRGNRFDLGLDGLDGAETSDRFRSRVQSRLERGVPNRFGDQRFGIGRVNLRIARTWAEGDPARAVEWSLDPRGRWRMGAELPSGLGSDPHRRLRAALARRPEDAAGALRAGGARFRRLIASAAQSAVFNAVLEARERLGLLRTLRTGDVALTPRGAPYVFPGRSPSELARASGPLPGRKMLRPETGVLAGEQAWSAPSGVDWSWFERGAVFDSPGERRALLIDFIAGPELHGSGADARLTFTLPRGNYATEVLLDFGVGLPPQRQPATGGGGNPGRN